MSTISKKVENILKKNFAEANYIQQREFEWFNEDRIGTHLKKVDANLFFPLNKKHEKQYSVGDGSELSDKGKLPAKMKSIFSSSALAVNSFNWIEECNQPLYFMNDVFSKVDFEKRLITLESVKGRNIYANIDVFLEGKNTLIFIESKFTETYGSSHHNILSESYHKENSRYNYDRYNVNLWNEFINQLTFSNPVTRFDLQQNIKHLIGIYNFLTDNPQYDNHKVVLLNLIYNVNSLGDNTQILKQNESYDDFNRVKSSFTRFATESLKIKNFRYEYLHYEDFINTYVSDAETRSYLKKRYFGVA